MGMNKNSVNKRRQTVTLSFNDEEYQELTDKAAEIGLKPSTVARRMLLEHIRFFAQ